MNRSEIKLSFLGTEYTYDGNKVMCEVEYAVLAPYKYYNLVGGLWGRATGTAVCHPEDEYDKEKGRKIALAKAEAKAYKKVAAKLEKRFAYIENLIELCRPLHDGFIDKANSCVAHNAEYVDRIAN